MYLSCNNRKQQTTNNWRLFTNFQWSGSLALLVFRSLAKFTRLARDCQITMKCVGFTTTIYVSTQYIIFWANLFLSANQIPTALSIFATEIVNIRGTSPFNTSLVTSLPSIKHNIFIKRNSLAFVGSIKIKCRPDIWFLPETYY